jgi:hypothetical protein
MAWLKDGSEVADGRLGRLAEQGEVAFAQRRTFKPKGLV